MDKIQEMFGINWTDVNRFLISSGSKLLVALAILVIGWWLAKKAQKAIQALMGKSAMDPGLTSFVSSVAGTTLKVLVVLTAAGQLGIQMTSFIALIGAAGLAVGMAFSGALSNLAGGIMILFFKPFKVDDFIQAQGEDGFVKAIHIFNTYMLTFDNRTVIIPNGPLANGNIVNFTNQGIRRVDLEFGFNYGGDYDKVKAVVKNIVDNHPKVLKDPAPFIAVGGLGSSSVNVAVRPWALAEDYWTVHFEMNELIYKEFAKNNIAIPFPQMDVHIKSKA